MKMKYMCVCVCACGIYIIFHFILIYIIVAPNLTLPINLGETSSLIGYSCPLSQHYHVLETHAT